MGFLSSIDYSAEKTVLVLCAVLGLASIDILRRISHRPTHLFFATVLGSSLSLGLIRTVEAFLQPGIRENPFAIALGVVLVVIGWKMLFGPWDSQTKATMLGTFLFWIALHLFWDEAPRQRSERLIAAATALVPAVIWCILFLKYHAEKWSAVVLLFFAGMLSTVPILFYDLLVRKGVEMQFFLFAVKPENFTRVSQSFVEHFVGREDVLKFTLLSSLVSFLIVGCIEELSKFWVMRASGRKLFSSIDDVMQLSIIVAIGFAFAENIINPVYFTAFVRDYLFHAASPDLVGFLSNVLGRSVLTSMVHIVCTGITGYFFGLALFAAPYLRERREEGNMKLVPALLHRFLRLDETAVFRMQMILSGLFLAIVLHGLFNFLVTLPELLPGNPQTMGDLFATELPAFIHPLPLLLFPALFYVVGGFWLLTWLFGRKENMLERGHIEMKEVFVKIVEE